MPNFGFPDASDPNFNWNFVNETTTSTPLWPATQSLPYFPAVQPSVAVPMSEATMAQPGHLPSGIIPDHQLSSTTNHQTVRRRRARQGSRNARNRVPCDQPDCRATFGRPQDFRRHLRTVHSPNEAVEFRCTFCSYTYPRLDKVQEHMEKMHGRRIE
ncbi:unnamed protein product [Periconia digitata]|uniref:C2H2-type domain-containing protein n=1 Tax=Periconia digitata TaxID=1303443 RepID=A0A9W4XD38_9PLEO|nr:unnamed protein product [Periconia digitata]